MKHHAGISVDGNASRLSDMNGGLIAGIEIADHPDRADIGDRGDGRGVVERTLDSPGPVPTSSTTPEIGAKMGTVSEVVFSLKPRRCSAWRARSSSA